MGVQKNLKQSEGARLMRFFLLHFRVETKSTTKLQTLFEMSKFILSSFLKLLSRLNSKDSIIF